MYFDRVYRDEDAMTFDVGGTVVSSLLLQRYRIHFHNAKLPVSYVAGAATRRSHRGMGYMGRLIKNALVSSYERGDMMCVLIPAHDWLYFFYDRSGFATVFYDDVQRYTSDHTFPVSEDKWSEYDDHYSDKVYEAFSRLEKALGAAILHSHRDFLNIIDDLRMDAGRLVVMQDEVGNISSMAFATASEDLITVRAILADNEEAASAALHRLKEYYPSKAFKVMALPGRSKTRKLTARGMGRIVNAEICLVTLAAANPSWSSCIRISDPIIRENNKVFHVSGGNVETISYTPELKLDLDTNITTFTEIVFSSERIGDILSFPSCRPYIYLMLD